MRKDPYLAEYFGGLRDSRYAVMYPFLSLMYKAGIAMLCAARLDNSSSETLGYILLIHGVHIAYLLFCRPFSQAKDSVICMKNQVFVVSLLIPLFTYKDPEKWGTTITWGWIVSIISANAMTAFGLVVQFVTRMYKEYTLLPTGNEVRAINPKAYERGFTPSSTTKKLNKVHNFDEKSQGGKSPHGEESFSPRMKDKSFDMLNLNGDNIMRSKKKYNFRDNFYDDDETDPSSPARSTKKLTRVGTMGGRSGFDAKESLDNLDSFRPKREEFKIEPINLQSEEENSLESPERKVSDFKDLVKLFRNNSVRGGGKDFTPASSVYSPTKRLNEISRRMRDED
mmetsp:Transcript_35316/g.34977  ORF Transcript_35316/g.34977 Transcript_35316/m.34977 type:complete len:339 (-) Transcript_35316:46-1062(-)